MTSTTASCRTARSNWISRSQILIYYPSPRFVKMWKIKDYLFFLSLRHNFIRSKAFSFSLFLITCSLKNVDSKLEQWFIGWCMRSLLRAEVGINETCQINNPTSLAGRRMVGERIRARDFAHHLKSKWTKTSGSSFYSEKEHKFVLKEEKFIRIVLLWYYCFDWYIYESFFDEFFKRN